MSYRTKPGELPYFGRTEHACRYRIEDAEKMGWQALANSWRLTLADLEARKSRCASRKSAKH